MKKISMLFVLWIFTSTLIGVSAQDTATTEDGNEIQPAAVTAPSRPADWKSQMQAEAPDIYQWYRSGSRQANIGRGLTIGGVSAVIAGYAIIGVAFNRVSSADDRDMAAVGVGSLVAVAGSICAAVGTPIMVVGYVRKGRAKRAYFARYGNSAEYLQSSRFELRTNGVAFVF
jgi:hypothetical protein